MSQDIGKLSEKADAHFNAQRLLIQALQETQSDHTEALRDIRGKAGQMAPKVDAIETRVGGVWTRMGLLENGMGKLGTRMDELETTAGNLDGKIDAVNQRLDDRFGQLDAKIDAVIGMLRNGR